MTNTKTVDFLAMLRTLDESLKPHIHLGPVRFALDNKGTEIIHDPDEETHNDDIRLQQPVTLKELREAITKIPLNYAKGFIYTKKPLLFQPHKKPAAEGTVITTSRRPLSLAELVCKELPLRDIQRFITRTETGQITPHERKQFKRRFLGMVRKITYRELTRIINELPPPVRGRTERRREEANKFRKEVFRLKKQTQPETEHKYSTSQAVKDAAERMGIKEVTGWKYLASTAPAKRRARQSPRPAQPLPVPDTARCARASGGERA